MNPTSDSKELIIKIKKVREEQALSLNDVMKLLEENGSYISKTTLSRFFADNSEDIKFRYEDTIRPIANALLDIDNIEETDDMNVQTMKELLKFKNELIENMEQQIIEMKALLDHEKLKTHEKVDKERMRMQVSIDLMQEQIAYKDKRMDEFIDMLKEKDAQLAAKDEKLNELIGHIMNCPYKCATK